MSLQCLLQTRSHFIFGRPECADQYYALKPGQHYNVYVNQSALEDEKEIFVFSGWVRLEESAEDTLVSVHLDLDGKEEHPIVYVFETLEGGANASVHAYLTLSGNENAHPTVYLCMQCIGLDPASNVTIFTNLTITETGDSVQQSSDTSQKYDVTINSTTFQLNYVNRSATDFLSMVVRLYTKPYFDLLQFY